MIHFFGKRRVIVITACLALFFVSCHKRKSNVQLPKVPQAVQSNEAKGEKKPLDIKRYEQALFALNKSDLPGGLAKMHKEYAFFLGDDWRDTVNINRIANFLSDNNIRELYALTQKTYPNVSSFHDELKDALDIYRSHYPEKPYPKVFSYVSGLDLEHPVYYFDTAMAIGLDLFLGNIAEKAYEKAGIPKYKIARFKPEFLVPQCMLAIADKLIPKKGDSDMVLTQMVQQGKMLYFLDVTLPEKPDHFKIGYTPEQLEWCQKNEGNIWAFLIENQLLFSTDPMAANKLITDGPFSSGFEKGAPARLGAYIGWQMVRKYMEEAPGTSLKTLMANNDARQILKESHYKPKK